ncbi:phosphoglycerate kinase [Bartonella sp. DGB1]|uniref:phosphoglycerate kinase n=1 Tax=Bartonella sp. DGB1 TaxID=3239807 RepID=UPI003523480C
MKIKNLDNINVNGKTILVRLDLNVPLINGQIVDTIRIDRSIETIQELQKNNAKIVLMSHFGRPEKADKNLSLRPIGHYLEQILNSKVKFLEDSIGAKVVEAVKNIHNGEIILLENLRFHAGEQKNDRDFAQKLASLGDLIVQDALSVAHRKHASTYGIAEFLPMVAGRALEKELNALEIGLEKPQTPVVAIVGGAKVSTKIDLLENLVKKVNALIIGGAMANNFLLAQGYNVGKSLIEPDAITKARQIIELAKQHNCVLILPIDAVVAWHFKENSPHQTYAIDAIAEDGMILDLGDASIEKIKDVIENAKSLLWNGPLGAFEMPPFDKATTIISKFVAAQTRENKLVSVAGGGDTLSALKHANVVKDFTYVSTAGGAFLEWLEGKELPTISLLKKN